MDKVLAVHRMQDYIQQHIADKITLSDLSRVALYSPFYCVRIFKELTGMAPTDYIRRAKLSMSAVRLKSEKCKVTDVAYDTGYKSVDGYQRAFLNEFGCNPHQYSKSDIPISLFTPYGAKFNTEWKEGIIMANAISVFIQVIDKPERKAIIKRGKKASEYWEYCEEVGCDVWNTLASMKSLSGEPVCLWLPAMYRKEGTSEYVQGVEIAVNEQADVPEGFDMITLPATKYLVFQGEPFQEENYNEAIVAVQAAMNRYDPSVIGYAWDEKSPRIQLEPRGKRGYIEMKAVVSL